MGRVQPLQSLDYFTRSLLHYQYFFFLHFYATDAVSLSPKTLCPSELFTRPVSAGRRPQNGFLGLHSAGYQKVGSLKVLNGECREDEREESTPLSQ